MVSNTSKREIESFVSRHGHFRCDCVLRRRIVVHQSSDRRNCRSSSAETGKWFQPTQLHDITTQSYYRPPQLDIEIYIKLVRVLEILLFRAVITFNWNQLLLRLKKLIKELHIQPPFKFSLTNHFWSYWTSKKFRPSLRTNCFRFWVFLFVTKKPPSEDK